MKIITSEKDSYIPKWNKNRDLLEDEQIIVEYTNLSWDVRRKHHKKDKTKYIVHDIKNVKDEDIDKDIDEMYSADAEIAVGIDTAAITVAMKPTIRNLTDENDEPIDTWDKLLKTRDACGLRNLIVEIEGALTSSQRGKDSKNS